MNRDGDGWVNERNAPLLTDLYELTMLQAYFREGMTGEAVFDLTIRRLPTHRNYLIAAGLDEALRYLERLRFDDDSITFLKQIKRFGDDFLDWLRGFRFTGTVRAAPEGTPVFANEPILQVIAPIPEAQIAETFLLNQVHHQTMMASKAARVVSAARGRTVVDFGLRRMHGVDAGMKAARAFHIAGVNATSNVLAGKIYDLSIAGTMAHSYIEAHNDELDAFRAFAEVYPDTVLLVDTYDTLDGVRKVIDLARELGEAFRVQAVRLDSGDLAALSRQARAMLDDAGLEQVGLFASGGLDEFEIDRLLEAEAPIDGFGVGSNLGVSVDAPVLDSAYKLAAYDGESRMKLSTNKTSLPGRKQVYRLEESGAAVRDVIALAGERLDGRPLLVEVMTNGTRLDAGWDDLAACRERCARELDRLPSRLRSLEPADPPYPVELSAELQAEIDRLRHSLTASPAGG